MVERKSKEWMLNWRRKQINFDKKYTGAGGNYLYIYLSSNNEPIYVGSTSNMNVRQQQQLTGNSNLKMNINELIEKYDFKRIVYKDFEELNREDLYVIDGMLQRKSKPKIEMNDVRLFREGTNRSNRELFKIMDNLDIEEMDEFNISRYKNKAS
jgi:hypothetical protein